MTLRMLEMPESRAALMDRYFKDGWSITEQREMVEIHGWLHGSGVQVRMSGLKSGIAPILMAFFSALDEAGVPERRDAWAAR